jgi:FAD/FMN-containing dehydrogenase
VNQADATESGGGNFGVATAFEFQLHPVGPVLAGKVVYPLEHAREVLRFYQEFTSHAPDELTAYACLSTTQAGLPTIAINLCYCGSLEEGERAVSPLRAFGNPLVDLVRPRSYLKMISLADAGAPAGRHYYEKARTLKSLSDEAIEAIATYGSSCTSPHSLVLIQHVHGAASRVASTETAFALREESYVTSIVAAWEGGAADRHIGWARACWSALEPFASSGVYVNFLGDEGEGRVRASYRGNYERLVALKNHYDPTNFFAYNQNIKPTPTEASARPAYICTLPKRS